MRLSPHRSRTAALALLGLVVLGGCSSDGDPPPSTTRSETTAVPGSMSTLGSTLATSATQTSGEEVHRAAGTRLVEVASPDGGIVRQLVIPGPETSVLVTCDRSGFEPFHFADRGDWVGCRIGRGDEPGPGSDLTGPVLREVASPEGGTVAQVVVPGPEVSVLVACEMDGFEPFLFSDQEDWVGCGQRS